MDGEGSVIVFVRNCYIWVNFLVIWYIFCFKVLFVRQLRSCLEMVYGCVIGQEVVIVEYGLGVDFVDIWYGRVEGLFESINKLIFWENDR